MRKIYLFAVIFALIAGVATYFFVNSLQHNSAVTGVKESDVVIALEDIEKDTIVTPDMFQVVKLPVSSITYGTLLDANEVNGFMATETIRKGEQVLASKLTDLREDDTDLESNGEYRLSYHLGEGQYAYTIAVDTNGVNSVAYFLRAGDYINIYDQFASAKENPILKNIPVLEIGTYSDHKMVKSGVETTTFVLLTLSMDEKQIETLMDVEENIRIALVPYAEGASLTTVPSTEPATDEEGSTVKEESLKEPHTNYGMGEITTAPPTTETEASATTTRPVNDAAGAPGEPQTNRGMGEISTAAPATEAAS
jgi:Flp pilus assembly protein CpaB